MSDILRGKLGYVVDGEYQIAADDAHYYVRFAAESGGGISVAAIRHAGRVAAIPDLDVQIGRDEDGLVLLGVDSSIGASMLPSGTDIGVHSHDRYSGMSYLSDDRLRLKLHVEIRDGLCLNVLPGIMHHLNKPLAWMGGMIDLVSPDMRPTTTAHHAWCVIGFAPSSSSLTLIAVTGESQSRAMPLERSQITDVPFAWDTDIPICAVRLRADATTLEEADLEALLHSAFGGTSLVSLDRALSDGDALLLDLNGDILWG